MPAKNGKEKKEEESRQVHYAIGEVLGEKKHYGDIKTEIKRAGPRSVMIYVRSNDRQKTKDSVAAKLKKLGVGVDQANHLHEFRESSFPGSQIKLVDNSKINLVYKNMFEGKVSTAMAEASQALFAALAMNVLGHDLHGCDQTPENWGKAFDSCDLMMKQGVKMTEKDAISLCTKLDDEWIKSNIAGANELRLKLPKNHFEFHRGSKKVEEIYKVFSSIKKDSKARALDSRLNIDPNKWSPADIYLIKKKFDVKKALEGIETIAALNAKMQELLNNNQVVGISLKKIKGTTANLKLINKVGEDEIFDIKFVDLTAPSESTSGYINMTKDGHKMKINFRNFTAQGGFSGEVLLPSGAARHGKISHGPINDVLALNDLPKIPDNGPARAQAPKEAKWMAQTMKDFNFIQSNQIGPTEEMIETSSLNYQSSKYLVLKLFESLKTLSKKEGGMDKITEEFYRYAGSQIKGVSAPYLKLS